jgi:hypothetical protein
MSHTMAAQDFERAASVIDENIGRMLSRSEAPVLLGWIEKLPEEIVRGCPWIDVYRANTLALSGQSLSYTRARRKRAGPPHRARAGCAATARRGPLEQGNRRQVGSGPAHR